MVYSHHDLHFVAKFRVHFPILYKLSLVKFFCCKGCAVVLLRDLVDGGKGTLANLSDEIVLVSALPLSTTSTDV